jgi:hypothetical protein
VFVAPFKIGCGLLLSTGWFGFEPDTGDVVTVDPLPLEGVVLDALDCVPCGKNAERIDAIPESESPVVSTSPLVSSSTGGTEVVDP